LSKKLSDANERLQQRMRGESQDPAAEVERQFENYHGRNR
jgi:BMFP domain-containing protein YqiC